MPTTRARHMITETDAVRSALEKAAMRWPEDAERPSRLLLKLIELGEQAVDVTAQERRERRRAAVRATSGMFSGVYEPGYLEELRKDWDQ